MYVVLLLFILLLKLNKLYWRLYLLMLSKVTSQEADVLKSVWDVKKSKI